MAVAERGAAQAHRAAPRQPGPGRAARSSRVSPRSSSEGSTTIAKGRGKRRALADWLTDPRNPRTARVMANRLWQYHFGRGIVPTPNDFGKLGEAPSHPELLDWLAAEFVAAGWKLKRMHRLIVSSSAYRMSSRATPAELASDPANRWFWRFPMRRLTAEEVRDSILAVSGSYLKAGGPSVYPPIPREVMAGQSVPGSGWKTSRPTKPRRRSVYVHVKRSLLVPILATHDAADTDASCPVRYTTTVPTQALGLLNGEFANEQAALFAERLRGEAPGDLACAGPPGDPADHRPRSQTAKRSRDDLAFVRTADGSRRSSTNATAHVAVLPDDASTPTPSCTLTDGNWLRARWPVPPTRSR